MGQRYLEFALDEYYHIYNRGTDKRVIFTDLADHRRFVELLYLCNSTSPVNVRDTYHEFDSVFDYNREKPIVAIGAYCLMPNHFHILLTPLTDTGVSDFMKKLGTSYSMYFNKKYERTGSLFEGKYKAQYVDTDEYLQYLYAYIHLNPVKLIQSDWKVKGINNPLAAYDYAASYQYSSLTDYLKPTKRSKKILTPDKFPEYFSNPSDHHDDLMGWLSYSL